MLAHDLTTVDLVYREDETTFHARNPFPVGGVVEDPATGAAAAAFGAYLRELGLITPPATITVHQGVDMGRPSLLTDRASPPTRRRSASAVAPWRCEREVLRLGVGQRVDVDVQRGELQRRDLALDRVRHRRARPAPTCRAPAPPRPAPAARTTRP